MPPNKPWDEFQAITMMGHPNAEWIETSRDDEQNMVEGYFREPHIVGYPALVLLIVDDCVIFVRVVPIEEVR